LLLYTQDKILKFNNKNKKNKNLIDKNEDYYHQHPYEKHAN